MKKFKFLFNVYIILLLVLTLAISLTALGFNIYMIIETPPFDSDVKYIILGVICIILTTCVLLVIFNSKYLIKEGKIILTVGLITTAYPIEKIMQLSILEEGNTLVCYFEDATFTRIVIKKQAFDTFISAVKEINDKIILQSSSTKQ